MPFFSIVFREQKTYKFKYLNLLFKHKKKGRFIQPFSVHLYFVLFAAISQTSSPDLAAKPQESSS